MATREQVRKAAASGGSREEQTERLRALLEAELAQASLERLGPFLDCLCDEEEVDVMAARPLLAELPQRLLSLGPPLGEALLLRLLEGLQARPSASVELETAMARERLADHYAESGRFADAAQAIGVLNVDSSTRLFDDNAKMRIWLKTARFYIAFDESVQADKYTNRAGQLITSSTPADLATAYKECFAACQDYKRKYKEAARNYYILASDPAHKQLSPSLREDYLRKACLCTILGRAGEQRSRMLSTLYKDERCMRLDVYPMLQDMHLERLVAKEDVVAFSRLLKPHQQALLADGSTVLQNAVVMHNLRSSSRLYTNISFQELGKLLETSEEKAEKAAADLISEGGMEGRIDQIHQTIHFSHDNHPVKQWDEQIREACSAVNDTLDLIASKYPQQFAKMAAGAL